MKTCRRDFIRSFAAFAAASSGWDVFAGRPTAEIPVYYTDYLASFVARVNRHRMEDRCETGFWFVTDLHIASNARRSGLLLSRLVAETGMTRVFCGGDLPVAFGTPQELDVMVRRHWPELWRGPIEKAGGTVFLAKGNHDFHITLKDRRKEHLGFQYSAEESAEIIRSCSGNAKAVTDGENPSACYCYFDAAEERVRYVIADTSDAPCRRQEKVGVEGGHVQMSDRQLKWLAEQAFAGVPEGYGVVVIHHVPLAKLVATSRPPATLQSFKALLAAYQERRSVTLAGSTFDFTKRKGGDILMDLTGHHHSDRQSYEDGMLHLSESCDAGYGDYFRRTPFSGTLPVKKRGTVNEQTFDCIQVSRQTGRVYVTRFGGGQDRVYHLKPLSVRAGSSTRLKAEALTAVTSWLSVDCDDCAIDSSATTPEAYWTFRTRHGTVGKDGTFVAGTPGPSMAIAFDASLRKEFFPVMSCDESGDPRV